MRTICNVLVLILFTAISPAAFAGPQAVDDTNRLIKDLNNGKYMIRIGALRKIAGSGGPSAQPTIPIIRQILQRHGDPNMRAAAAQALQAIGPKGLPVLIETLNDKNTPGDNLAVIKAIASFGPLAKDVAPTLIEIIEGGNPRLQEHAVKALGEIGMLTPAVLPSLIKMLESTNEFSPKFNELTETLSRVAAPQDLVPLLESGQRVVRIGAASALGKMGDKAQVAVPALIARLNDNKEPHKYAQALGGIGILALSDLVKVIEDPSSPRMQRIYAVMAIGEIGPAAKEAVPLLINSLRDLELIHMAVEALGKLGSEASAAVPQLIELKDSSEYRYIRNQAAEALVQIGTQEARDATGLFRIKERLFDAMFAVMRVFLFLPGLVFVVPLILYVLYALTKKHALHAWAYRPLLLSIALWGLYAVYETSLQLFWASGEPIRVDLLVITPILFAALAIGIVPWGINLLLPGAKRG